MYESTSEPHEFVADGRDDAIAKACRHFGVEAEALTITEFPAGEVYGLAGRTLVVAYPKDRQLRGPGGGGGESRAREREDRPRRGGRERGARRGERRDRGDRGDRGRDRERPREPAPEAPKEPTVATAKGELGALGTFLLGVVERMDLGPFEVSEDRDGELQIVHVVGTAAEELASGDGRTVDALQLLANQVAMRLEEGRVVVDIEGDADARESLLSSLAQRVARRARDTGRAVALDPMNSRDRRMIHVALRDDDDVATMSVGEGRYRQVVVVPEGAPEFENAKRESEELASRAES